MADKMLRIAARTDAGVAKPIKADDYGNIGVVLAGNVTENTGKNHVYYKEGIEVQSIIKGYVSGNQSYTENSNHIELAVSGNPASVAEVALSTATTVDLTNLAQIVLDFEMTGTTGYNSTAYLVIGASSSATHQYFTKRETITLNGGIAIARKKISIDVTELTGSHYVRVHLRDNSASVDVPAKIKIYGIEGKEKEVIVLKTTNYSPMMAKNKTGDNTELTTEIDDRGQGVLRIINAAPHAYNPLSDRIETNHQVLGLIKEQDGNMIIPANGSLELLFNTPVLDYKKVLVVFRLSTSGDNANIKVNVENRITSTGFVIYAEEKQAVAGKLGHKAEFDLSFPRLYVSLINSSASPITLQRYAIVGVK